MHGLLIVALNIMDEYCKQGCWKWRSWVICCCCWWWWWWWLWCYSVCTRNLAATIQQYIVNAVLRKWRFVIINFLSWRSLWHFLKPFTIGGQYVISLFFVYFTVYQSRNAPETSRAYCLHSDVYCFVRRKCKRYSPYIQHMYFCLSSICMDKFCMKYPFLARKYRILMILFSWEQYSIILIGESLRKLCSDRPKIFYIPGDENTF